MLYLECPEKVRIGLRGEGSDLAAWLDELVRLHSVNGQTILVGLPGVTLDRVRFFL